MVLGMDFHRQEGLDDERFADRQWVIGADDERGIL